MAKRRAALLTTHEKVPLLTDRNRPHLSTAVLDSLIDPAHNQNALAGRADLQDGPSQELQLRQVGGV
jgi:hypothetical protein